MNILVTGACGVTSRAVARSLRISSIFGGIRLVGTDICENLYGLGEGLFEKIFKVPLSSSPDYLAVLRRICEREEIDLAVVVPEPEVVFWSESVDFVPALLPPPALSRIALGKHSLYDALAGSGLVPDYRVFTRDEVLRRGVEDFPMPCWLRDCTPGSTSGRAALPVSDRDQARAWALLQKGVRFFMASELLPGRNFACCLLFQDDELLKFVTGERLKYFAGHLVLSGITGNTCEGRLVNDNRVRSTAEKSLRALAGKTGERLNGLFTVDLRENCDGLPLVTEINLRHVAFTSAFAAAGANMAEAQLLATLGLAHHISGEEIVFGKNNLFLRDIDGAPQWFPDRRPQAAVSATTLSACRVPLTAGKARADEAPGNRSQAAVESAPRTAR